MNKVKSIFVEGGLPAVARRATQKIVRLSRSRFEEVRARWRGSYILTRPNYESGLISRLNGTELEQICLKDCIPERVSRHYLDHRFDLLGSGWTQVRYGMRCRGMGGHRYDMGKQVNLDSEGCWLTDRVSQSNLKRAQVIWQKVDADYTPIDWQLDFKSGYRWSESVWAARLPYGHLLGVDVKVPWELARMQHLPQMALRANALGRETEEARLLVRDIRNQYLDFIATNPPGFGVNWICPMDVAIRAANWSLTWDILNVSKCALPPDVEEILACSLYDHGRYIVGHLEWSNERANHYLANICGLVFTAAYLPENSETDKWLAFAIGQLNREVMRQFLPDGGNFEGSIAYHRLSLEMVLYACCLILGLPQTRLSRLEAIDPKTYNYLPAEGGSPPQWGLHESEEASKNTNNLAPFDREYVARLGKATFFFMAVLKSDGSFPQIGDNDSGRFFKVNPRYTELPVHAAKKKYLNLADYNDLDIDDKYFFEENSHGLHLLRVAESLGLVKLHDKKSDALVEQQPTIDYILSCSLAASRRLLSTLVLDNPPLGARCVDDSAAAFLRQYEAMKVRSDVQRYTYYLPMVEELEIFNVALYSFASFGVYVFKHKSFYLLIRCVTNTELWRGGHHHDDQLSVELTINDTPIFRDPGTYLYTALPNFREKYRSSFAHISPLRGIYQDPDEINVFAPIAIHPADIVYCGPHGFSASINCEGNRAHLIAQISDSSISLLFVEPDVTSRLDELEDILPFSPGYGIQEQAFL
jgi:hypothetical protein